MDIEFVCGVCRSAKVSIPCRSDNRSSKYLVLQSLHQPRYIIESIEKGFYSLVLCLSLLKLCSVLLTYRVGGIIAIFNATDSAIYDQFDRINYGDCNWINNQSDNLNLAYLD